MCGGSIEHAMENNMENVMDTGLSGKAYSE